MRSHVLLQSFVFGVFGLGTPVTATDAIDAFMGQQVVQVSLRSEGRTVQNLSIVELVETRVGFPLSMRQVRESLMHLINVGNYQDIRIGARLVAQGVALEYDLVPLDIIRKVEFDGDLRVPADELRETVVAVHGDVFGVGQVPAVVETLQHFYKQHGFMRAKVGTDVTGTSRARQILRVQIEAGPRARVSQVFLRGVSFAERDLTLQRLGLDRIQFYDGTDVDRQLVDYETELRTHRRYQAALSHSVDVSQDGLEVDLWINVQRGPRIMIEFSGDVVPGEDLADLVAVEQEGLVDEDLLEDDARRIERRLNELGYRDASVGHKRDRAGEELSIVFEVDRGPLYEIAAIVFTGNDLVADATIANLIDLTVERPLVTHDLDSSLVAIIEHYRQLGFASADAAWNITPIDLDTVDPTAETIDVICEILIAEEVQTSVRSVELDVPAGYEPDEWLSLIPVAAGDPYSVRSVVEGREALRVSLLNKGFESAVVLAEPQFDETFETVDVVYRVNLGNQVIIDHVLIVGNTGIESQTIRREITLVPGNPLSLVDVSETRRRLNALGLFRRIDVREFTHGGQGLRDVVIIVDEAPATRVGYGGGLEASVRLRRETDKLGSPAVERLEFAPRGFVQIGRGNLWGKNRSIDLFIRASLRRKNQTMDARVPDTQSLGINEHRILGTYQEPRVLNTEWDGFINGFVEQAIRPGFDLFSRGVNGQIIRQLTPNLTASIDYGWGQNEVSNNQLSPEDQRAVDILFPQVRLSAFSSSFVWDTRDDEVDPHGGELVTFDSRVAARAVGSEVGFTKFFAGVFIYREVPRLPRFVLAIGARVGLAQAFEFPLHELIDDEDPLRELKKGDLPLSERFFAGGDTSVRGFALDRLGDKTTLDNAGFPLGGNATLVFNGEVRFSMMRTIDLVGFLDGGNVYDRVSSISLTRIRGGAGFGVRYRSPVGPIRVDLGLKLDRREFGTGEDRKLEPPTALHISIGQAF